MAGNLKSTQGHLKSTQGHHRLHPGSKIHTGTSEIYTGTSQTPLLVWFSPKKQLRCPFPVPNLQCTCDSHPLNLIYEVGCVLPLYSHVIPGNIYFRKFFHVHESELSCTLFESYFPKKISFHVFFSCMFSCVCLPSSTFSLKTGQWLISFGMWGEFNFHIWVSRRWKRE